MDYYNYLRPSQPSRPRTGGELVGEEKDTERWCDLRMARSDEGRGLHGRQTVQSRMVEDV